VSRADAAQKKGDVCPTPPVMQCSVLLFGAARSVAASASSARAEIDAVIDPESIAHKIHADGLGLFVELLVDDELESVHIEDVVGVTRLIQSHGQGRTPSPTLVQEYPDGRNFFVFEIFGYLMMSGWGDFYHIVPPRCTGMLAAVGAYLKST
jgi:hypothetical protein